MPQTTRRGVAPLNPRPRWPEGYLTVFFKVEMVCRISCNSRSIESILGINVNRKYASAPNPFVRSIE